ncbi:MAG: NADH-quinone oxidoreductase subunit NuoK [Euryarchaeota archaeon]|nr:NADH-quinone oxidoreductase subunit NuoK [Euryarchaeota archaeon]
MIPLYYYLTLAAALFALGAYGIMTQRNGIKILMCIEMLLNSANINLVAFAKYQADIAGQVLVTFTISLAAAEAAVGIAILIALYKTHGTIDITQIGPLRRW